VFAKINKPEFLEHVVKVGNYFRKRLEGLQSPLIREVRGQGLIIGVDIDLEKGLASFSVVLPFVTRHTKHNIFPCFGQLA